MIGLVSIVRPLDTQHSGDFLLFLKGPLTPPSLKKFPCQFLELTMYSSKSVNLATVELCTSCSQKADREGLSLKSEMKFHFCWGGKFFYSTSSCYSLNSFSFKWRCCSLVLLKSLWQKPVLTTHLSWNHLWGYNLCNVLKHTLTMNRTKYRQSQST